MAKRADAGELNEQQQRFVDEYFIDFNGTAAAKRAGYSEKTAHAQASTLLTNPKVHAALAAKQAAKAKVLDLTAENVLREMRAIAFSRTRNALRWGSKKVIVRRTKADGETEEEERIVSGVTLIDSTEIDDDTAAAISEVSETRDGVRIKFHDKGGALRDLGKHLNLFKDEPGGDGTVHIRVTGGLPKKPEDEDDK